MSHGDRGVIESYDEKRCCGLICTDPTKNRRMFHLHSIRLDKVGRQKLYAQMVGLPVLFHVVERKDRPGALAAMDIRPAEPLFDDAELDLETWHETSRVIGWNRGNAETYGVGLLERSNGDFTTFRENVVLTEGIEALEVGSFVYHRIAFKSRNGCGELFDPSFPLTEQIDPRQVTRAVDVEICRPEVEVSEPMVNAISPLLSDRFKNIPLRKIGIRRKQIA